MIWLVEIIRPPRIAETLRVRAKDRIAVTKSRKVKAALKKHTAIRYRIRRLPRETRHDAWRPL
jgi:hypothetical protein